MSKITDHNSELPDRLIGRRLQAKLLGDISMMTLHRRGQDPDFPKPIKIGGCTFRWLSEMMAYINRKATQMDEADAPPPCQRRSPLADNAAVNAERPNPHADPP